MTLTKAKATPSQVDILAKLYLEGKPVEIADETITQLCDWFMDEFHQLPLNLQFADCMRYANVKEMFADIEQGHLWVSVSADSYDSSVYPNPIYSFIFQGMHDGCIAKTEGAGGRVRDRVRKAPVSVSRSKPFKWQHYEPEIILLCERWYLTYPLSYRQVTEMVNERGLDVHHSTIYRWVQQYAPELDKRCRPYLRPTNDTWRVDETYNIKIKGKDRYLYRAVDSTGQTLDFLLTAHQNANAAKRFLCKALKAIHNQEPRVINVDKNAAYPKAVDELKEKEELSEKVELRQNKYLNNRIIRTISSLNSWSNQEGNLNYSRLQGEQLKDKKLCIC